MQTTTLPDKPDGKSPAGADIRFLVAGATGNMIHSTVPPRQVNRATIHATVSEFWFVLEGRGEIWRDNGADTELKYICIAMPPWPGASEASYVAGIWRPTV